MASAAGALQVGRQTPMPVMQPPAVHSSRCLSNLDPYERQFEFWERLDGDCVPLWFPTPSQGFDQYHFLELRIHLPV